MKTYIFEQLAILALKLISEYKLESRYNKNNGVTTFELVKDEKHGGD